MKKRKILRGYKAYKRLIIKLVVKRFVVKKGQKY
jgi:hypothetical protein